MFVTDQRYLSRNDILKDKIFLNSFEGSYALSGIRGEGIHLQKLVSKTYKIGGSLPLLIRAGTMNFSRTN